MLLPAIRGRLCTHPLQPSPNDREPRPTTRRERQAPALRRQRIAPFQDVAWGQVTVVKQDVDIHCQVFIDRWFGEFSANPRSALVVDISERSERANNLAAHRRKPDIAHGEYQLLHVNHSSSGMCDAIWLENAVDGNRQRRTDFAHSIVSEAAETLGERPYRNAFNRIEIDR